MTENWSYYSMESPFGTVVIHDDGTAITRVQWDREDLVKKGEENLTPIIEKMIKQLEEYFEGSRQEFDISIRFRGTDFQKRVWRVLRKIPYGETRTYQEIAELIENPKGCRAVGMANNKNQLNIVVPCHRVLSGTGKPIGYNGGIDVKKQLIRHELKNLDVTLG